MAWRDPGPVGGRRPAQREPGRDQESAARAGACLDVPSTDAARSRIPASPCPPPVLSLPVLSVPVLWPVSGRAPAGVGDLDPQLGAGIADETVAVAGPAWRIALVSDSCMIR